MYIRKKDEFRVSFSAVFSGFLLGLTFIPLTMFIALLPYYSYISVPLYLALFVLFVLVLIIYIILSTYLFRKKRYTTLYFSGLFSLVFPFLVSLGFSFGYPHIHHAIYSVLISFSELWVNPKRISMTPAPSHYLFSLASMLPGVVTGVLLLSAYFRKKRMRDTEYHQPKKKNYYYF